MSKPKQEFFNPEPDTGHPLKPCPVRPTLGTSRGDFPNGCPPRGLYGIQPQEK